MAQIPSVYDRHQVYLNNRQFNDLYADYERGYWASTFGQLPLLLSAKACFFKGEYKECLKVLKKVKKQFNTKILFQRQILMYKATYLLDPTDTKQLDRIIYNFELTKLTCPGQALTEFHFQCIDQLVEVVRKGEEMASQAHLIDKNKLRQLIHSLDTKKKYEGMPSYLISQAWRKRLKEYLQDKGPYPGPITNFDILNHVFQLQPHQQHGKKYMDKIIFPVTQNTDYFSVDAKYWKMLESTFSGNEVKRVFTKDLVNGQIIGANNIIKTIIQTKDKKVCLQWQAGTFWEKSVLPTLVSRFGLGQMKQETKNGQFSIIQPGIVHQPLSTIFFVNVDSNIIKANNEFQSSIKSKIIASYDLQRYNAGERFERCTIGLENLGSMSYLNTIVQLLSNVKQLMQYFVSNRYISMLNITAANHEGSHGLLTCAFADMLKRLWFHPKGTRFIDPILFKQTVIEHFQDYQQKKQADAFHFLNFLMNCLHLDLNLKSGQKLKQISKGKIFNEVCKQSSRSYNKNNNSVIAELFNNFQYEGYQCTKCQAEDFHFQSTPIISMTLPPDSPKLTIFMLQVRDPTEAKRIEVYINKMETVNQILNQLARYFLIDPKNKLYPFLYSQDTIDWEVLKEAQDLKYVYKQQSKGSSVFVYEVVPPEFDEEICLVSFEHKQKTTDTVVNDGFPRIMTVKKCFSDHEYRQELLQLVISTVPLSRFHRQKREYFKQFKHKKISNQVYKSHYRVITKMKLNNFVNSVAHKTIGETSNQTVTLEFLLDLKARTQILDLKERWKCKQCGKIRVGHKNTRIFQTSKYLLFHFDRMKEQKVITRVQYPIYSLNMKRYTESVKEGNLTYFLKSVVVHRGTLDLAHYSLMTLDFENEKWMEINDESVAQIEQSLVVDTNAYILLYQRND